MRRREFVTLMGGAVGLSRDTAESRSAPRVTAVTGRFCCGAVTSGFDLACVKTPKTLSGHSVLRIAATQTDL
jgi:hypothetical protein